MERFLSHPEGGTWHPAIILRLGREGRRLLPKQRFKPAALLFRMQSHHDHLAMPAACLLPPSPPVCSLARCKSWGNFCFLLTPFFFPFKSRSHYVFHSLAFSCNLHLQPSPRACACCGLLQISPSRLHQLWSGPVSAYLQLAAGQCGCHCGSQCSTQYIRTSVCEYIHPKTNECVYIYAP